MPDYQLLQHYEDFKLPNFKCYKTCFISLCIQKKCYMSDNTTKEDIYAVLTYCTT
jgi:hypothetical protein